MVLLTHEKLSKICQDNILLSKPIWKSSLISKKFKIIRGFQFFLSSSSFLCGFFGFRIFSSMLSSSFSMFLMSTFEGIIIEFFISFDQFRRSYGPHCLKIAKKCLIWIFMPKMEIRRLLGVIFKHCVVVDVLAEITKFPSIIW